MWESGERVEWGGDVRPEKGETREKTLSKVAGNGRHNSFTPSPLVVVRLIHMMWGKREEK